MSRAKVVAIIPAYNEAKTIGRVVKAAKKSKLLNEVVVVSDGSTDRTVKLAKAAGADIVVDLSERGGKGNAMLEGVSHTNAKILLFLDADLKGLKPEHIEQLVMPVIRKEKVMTVGVRGRGKLASAIRHYLPLIGGQRAMQRFVVEGVPDKYLKGFMAESALNYYCRSRGLPYGGIFLPNLKIRRKMQKVGVLKGLWQYIKMIYTVVKAIVLVRLAKLRGKF